MRAALARIENVAPLAANDNDPLGRLRQTVAGGVTTDFLYDGDRLVAEYVGASVARRYAHGAGVDEPLMWYEGAGVTGERWLHADPQGSIVAHTFDGGSATPYRYGPYGEPDAWAGARFRYTGQIALPDVQLYHYKARVYDPILGRFLQTDPVGYEDDLNLYAYVRNDPLNRTDPTGRLPPEGSIAEEQMFRGAQDTAARCGEGCAVAGVVLAAVAAAPILVAAAEAIVSAVIANPVAVVEASRQLERPPHQEQLWGAERSTRSEPLARRSQRVASASSKKTLEFL